MTDFQESIRIARRTDLADYLVTFIQSLVTADIHAFLPWKPAIALTALSAI